MHKIKIKPLSVNKAWQGRRFKTDDYQCYEEELFFKLPKIKIGKEKLNLEICVGYSNKASDIDNCLKPFLDILQKKYNFNDKQIYRIRITKDDVKKGEEYISFEINPL